MITTKDNLCDFAIGLFQKDGFGSISINMICQHIGVTRGSFYHHFQSKNDLLLYWFEKRIKTIEFNESIESPNERLKEYSLAHGKMIELIGYDLMYHVLMAEFELEGLHFPTYFLPHEKTISLLQEAMDRNEIQGHESIEILMDTYISATIGLIVKFKLEQGRFNFVDKMIHTYETIFKSSYTDEIT
ncbi:MAG: TetR/AcrR family transcriptional regulator [Candidatus Pristimantibacillus sp.]